MNIRYSGEVRITFWWILRCIDRASSLIRARAALLAPSCIIDNLERGAACNTDQRCYLTWPSFENYTLASVTVCECAAQMRCASMENHQTDGWKKLKARDHRGPNIYLTLDAKQINPRTGRAWNMLTRLRRAVRYLMKNGLFFFFFFYFVSDVIARFSVERYQMLFQIVGYFRGSSTKHNFDNVFTCTRSICALFAPFAFFPLSNDNKQVRILDTVIITWRSSNEKSGAKGSSM